MGRGHYHDRDAEIMHLSWLDLVDYDEQMDMDLVQLLRQEAWNDVQRVIDECLPPSFEPADAWDGDTPCWIIALNGLFKVMLHDEDTCLYIVVKPRNDLWTAEGRDYTALAEATLQRTATALWRRLSDHYALYARDTAWTSKRYEP